MSTPVYTITFRLFDHDEWLGDADVNWTDLGDAIEAFDALLVGPRGYAAKRLLKDGETILAEYAGATIRATPAWARKAAA